MKSMSTPSGRRMTPLAVWAIRASRCADGGTRSRLTPARAGAGARESTGVARPLAGPTNVPARAG